MKKNKKSYFKNSNLMYTLLCFLILIIFIAVHLVLGVAISWADLFDLGLFATAVIVFVVNAVANGIVENFEAKFEDGEKLMEDYDRLSKMYSTNSKLVKYTNKESSNKNIIEGRKHTKSSKIENESFDEYVFPTANAIKLKGYTVEIEDDKNKMYELPEDLKKISSELFSAHSHSKTYNQLNIRLDDIKFFNNKIVLGYFFL